ncbi:MAG: histidine phosphatase family protein [Bacteroidota bacterium]
MNTFFQRLPIFFIPKQKLIYLIGLLVCFAACKQEPPLPELMLTAQPNEVLAHDTSFQFVANRPVSWQLSDSSLATISSDGLLETKTSSGVVYLHIATTETDQPISRDTIAIRISSRAPELNKLRKGGAVIYLRHAIATVGSDQFNVAPGWHLSCNSDTARQLAPDGRIQAQELGAAFKALEIPISQIYVSEYCRCIQTVEEMGLELPYQTEEAITYYVYDEAQRHPNTLAFINQLVPGDQNILVVSHSWGQGSFLPGIAQGFSATFVPGSGAEPDYRTMLRDDEWRVLVE